MGLTEENARAEAARVFELYKTKGPELKTRLQALFDDLVQIKTDFPDTVTEVDTFIGQIKTQLQNMINSY